MAQAGASFELAKRMARQGGNMTLLAQALAEEALLDYYERSPETADDDPRPRIELLEQAQALAKRHAPPIVQMAISGWLAQDKAVAKDGDGADEALEWSHVTLERAKQEGPVGTGFVSSAGLYSGYGEEGNFEGFRGAVQLILNPSRALSDIEASLRLTKTPRGRAYGLVCLAKALITCKQPQEVCDRLSEAHVIGLAHSSATILHHVLSARVLMPPEWGQLRCVKQLDDLLRSGWAAKVPS